MVVQITVMQMLMQMLMLMLMPVAAYAAAVFDGCEKGQYYDSLTKSCASCKDLCANALKKQTLMKQTLDDCQLRCGIRSLTQYGCEEGQYYESLTKSCESCTDLCANALMKQTHDDCKSKCGTGYLTQSRSTTSSTAPPPGHDSSKKTIITVVCTAVIVLILLLIIWRCIVKRDFIAKKLREWCPPNGQQPQTTQTPFLSNGGQSQATHIELTDLSSPSTAEASSENPNEADET